MSRDDGFQRIRVLASESTARLTTIVTEFKCWCAKLRRDGYAFFRVAPSKGVNFL